MSPDYDIKEMIKRATEERKEKPPSRRINKAECLQIIRDYLANHGPRPTREEFIKEIHAFYPNECLTDNGDRQSSWTKAVHEASVELGRFEAWTGEKSFPFVPRDETVLPY